MAPNQQQPHHDDCERGRTGAPQQQLVKRREDCRDDRRQRGIAQKRGDDQPGRHCGQTEPRVQRQQHARRGGDTLASLEPEEHRPQMAEQGCQPDQRHGALLPPVRRPEASDDQHRQVAFQGVEDQRQYRGQLVARTQHVGRTRVARTVGARIVQAHPVADDDSKRQRADQIGSQGDEEGRDALHGRMNE